MQVRTLDLYLEQMEQKMEDMRTEQKEKIRLYQSPRSDRRGYFWQSSSCKKSTCMTINLIFKIAAVGILVSILCQVLKHSGEEQAFLTSLAGLLLV